MQRLLLILIMMIFLTTTVLSQDSPPRQSLSDCADMYCYSVERIGANGNIFVYHEDAFYEVDSITSVVTRYDVGTYFRQTGMLLDFVVLPNHKVIVAESYLEFKLTLIDLQTNSAIELTHNMSGLFVCGGITGGPFNRLRNIFLVDESHVLLCSREGNRSAYFNLARLENHSLVLEQHFRFGAYGEVTAYSPSWFTVLAGLDGKAYLVPHPNNLILHSQFSESIDKLDLDTFAVLAYEPISQSWSEQIVDVPTSRPELITDVNFLNVELIAVDELGNLYFLKETYPFTASSLTKFTPNGQKLWELTEMDLGGIFDSVIISGSSHATIFFRDNSFLPIDLSGIGESS